MNNRLNFENNNNELSFGVPKSKMSMNYNDSYNKPSINGVELKGNLTSEDLKLSGGSDIELITELKPESIEEELDPNQVYNGNAIHDLARIFGIEMESVKKQLPNIITEFDIEGEYSEEDVYNANAILQLLELFVYEITMIQEGYDEISNNVRNHEDRLSALETVASELEVI